MMECGIEKTENAATLTHISKKCLKGITKENMRRSNPLNPLNPLNIHTSASSSVLVEKGD